MVATAMGEVTRRREQPAEWPGPTGAPRQGYEWWRWDEGPEE